VPFAREYGGLLANRSFGGAQVSRTFYARGQTGQQLLLGAYQSLCRQIDAGTVLMYPHTEMLDVVLVNGHAKGIITRNLATGKIEAHVADAVVLATGGYGNVFYLSTNARGSNVTATYRAYKKGALFANPCYTQIHPTCIPVSGQHQSKLTLMSESLRNDGRVWVPKNKGDQRKASDIPEAERDYYLERNIRATATSPRATFPRAARRKLATTAAGLARRPRRLSRFRGRDLASRREDDPGALRQSLRHLREDHRRRRLQAADAHVPGGALHDGRTLG
jgi:succinate dehydrogenase / fumarate reductase flavoprotein subunit